MNQIKLRQPQKKRPKSQAMNRTTYSTDKKMNYDSKSYDLHTWVDFEDQIRKMAMKSFHSSINQSQQKQQIQPQNQKQQLQNQFKDIIKDVLLMNVRPDIFNKLSKLI